MSAEAEVGAARGGAAVPWALVGASVAALCVLLAPEPGEWLPATRAQLVALAFVAAAGLGVRGAAPFAQVSAALSLALPATVVAARVDGVALASAAPALAVVSILALARGAQASRGEAARLLGGGALIGFAACAGLAWVLDVHGAGAPGALAAIARWGPFGVTAEAGFAPVAGAALVWAVSFAGPRREVAR